MKKYLLLAVVLTLLGTLNACGQKGGLFLPADNLTASFTEQ